MARIERSTAGGKREGEEGRKREQEEQEEEDADRDLADFQRNCMSRGEGMRDS